MAINIYFRLAEMQRKYIVWVDAGLGAMVGVITVSLQSAFHLPCRSYGKEGGQDATYEHGHAGECHTSMPLSAFLLTILGSSEK